VQNYKNTLSSLGFNSRKKEEKPNFGKLTTMYEMQKFLKQNNNKSTFLKQSEMTKIPEEIPDYLKFDKCYNFDSNSYDRKSEIMPKIPDISEITEFCENLIIKCDVPLEAIVVSLHYIEKLMLSTGLLLNSLNWQRLLLISLILSAKVWTDEEIPNTYYNSKMGIFSIQELNELERIFLNLLEYKLHVNGSEYAKYYFILRTFADKEKLSLPLKAISNEKAKDLQRNSEKLGENLAKKIFSKTK